MFNGSCFSIVLLVLFGSGCARTETSDSNMSETWGVAAGVLGVSREVLAEGAAGETSHSPDPSINFVDVPVVAFLASPREYLPVIIASQRSPRIIFSVANDTKEAYFLGPTGEIRKGLLSEMFDEAQVAVRRLVREDGWPGLVVPGGRIALSDIPEGVVSTHSVEFFNVGSTPITLERSRVSCSCTTISVSTKSVMPWGVGRLSVDVNPGMSDSRYFSVDWMVESSTGEVRSDQVIEVRSRVIPKAGVGPAHVALGDLPLENPIVDIRVPVKAMGQRHLQDLERDILPVFLSPGLAWKGISEVDGQAFLALQADVREVTSSESGDFLLESLLSVKHGAQTEIQSVTADGRVIPRIRAIPEVVNCGRVGVGEQVVRHLEIQSDLLGEILCTTATTEIVSAEVRDRGITLHLSAPAENGFFRTSLLVRLGDRALNVPIMGWVEK